MKTKPVLIASAGIVLLAGILFFIFHKNSARPDKAEVQQFLDNFNAKVNEGNTDSLFTYFDAHRKLKTIKRLINFLEGKKDFNGKGKPLAKIYLDVDRSTIKIINTDLVIATIPVTFSHDSFAGKSSVLSLKIYKVARHKFKIIQMDLRQFLTDYTAYANLVISKTVPDTAIFSPITLAAFKTADQLKTRYDSVVWFQHIEQKTYYFVLKGTLSRTFYWRDDNKEKDTSNYKMGLVGPDLKEIIPVEYSLIHNINGTLAGLIEVEKSDKKGLFNLDGKIVVEVDYDQIFPLNDDNNLALLRKNDDYFYLKKNYSITEKLPDLRIEDIVPKIKNLATSYTLSDSSSKSILEYNAHDTFTSLIISPSYLVDLQILPRFIDFQNPLRRSPEDESGEGDGDGSLTYQINFDGKESAGSNWFESIYHSIVDDYLGSRPGLYESKNLLVVDKKQNRILSFDASSYFGGAEGGGYLSGKCNQNYFRSINDTLFEFKTTSYLDVELFDKNIVREGPYYHYLHIINGQLVPVPSNRIFACTKFVKMDDSYLNGCFVINDKTIDHVTPEILKYMKNEIYASYGYKFKNERWNDVFAYHFAGNDKAVNTIVDDSLTANEKYNIEWINNKLNGKSLNTLAVK